MPTETRYFRNATHTVNGLSAYQLGTSNTATSRYVVGDAPGGYDYVGIRVWKRSADGVETEITGGLAVARVLPPLSDTPALRSATWNCPQTSLASTDAIVVRVYMCAAGGNVYTLLAEFITEQLGASSLDASTWTVYYYVRRAIVDSEVVILFYFGSDSYPSRIENFTWIPYIPTVEKKPLIDGFVYVE